MTLLITLGMVALTEILTFLAGREGGDQRWRLTNADPSLEVDSQVHLSVLSRRCLFFLQGLVHVSRDYGYSLTPSYMHETTLMSTWLLSTTPQGAFIPLCTWMRSPPHLQGCRGVGSNEQSPPLRPRGRTGLFHRQRHHRFPLGNPFSLLWRCFWNSICADLSSVQPVDHLVCEDRPSLLLRVAGLPGACLSASGTSPGSVGRVFLAATKVPYIHRNE